MPATMHRRLGPSTPAPRPPAPPTMPAPPQIPQMPAAPPPQVQAPPPVAPPQVVAPPVNGGAPAPGGAPSPGVPGGVPGGHVAQTNPDLADYLARVRARLDNPGNDQAAYNQAGIAANQFAQGQRNNATASALQRGVFGIGGAEAQQSDDFGVQAQGNFAKMSENIALQRLRDNDNFLAGAQGAFAEPGRQNLADRGLGIQAAGQQGQLDVARGRMQLDAALANQNAAMAVGQQNFQAQLQAQAMAQQQAMQMYQIYANLYGR